MKFKRIITAMVSSVLLCGSLTVCSFFSLNASADSINPSAEKLSRDQIRNIFLNEGIDEKLVDAAMNAPAKTGNNIADYVATYYAKPIAVNEYLRIYSRTFYGSQANPNPVTGTSYIQPWTSWTALTNPAECIVNIDDGFLLHFNCRVSVPNSDKPLFDVRFTNNGYSGTGAPISIHANSCVFLEDGDDQYYVNWNTYLDCRAVGLGDVTLDGTIDLNDALAAIYIKNNDPVFTFTDVLKQKRAANVDHLDDVTQYDVNRILEYIANQRSSFFP